MTRVNCDGKQVVRLCQFFSGMYLLKELFTTRIIIVCVGLRQTTAITVRGTVCLIEERGAMLLSCRRYCQFSRRYHVPYCDCGNEEDDLKSSEEGEISIFFSFGALGCDWR